MNANKPLVNVRHRGGGRCATLLAALALLAWPLAPLEAAVIDDFTGGWKVGGQGGGWGETNYFRWGVANDQMVISKQNPIPTPRNEPAATYDNVWWRAAGMPGELKTGRAVEVRMDLIHMSADDLFFSLWCGGGNCAYIAFVDRNEVALAKCELPGAKSGVTIFWWDSVTHTNENVNVRLAVSRTDDDSATITVKVVDKGNQQATLYERSFVDGPGQDGPVPQPDPHGVVDFFTPDPGGPGLNYRAAYVACWQLIYTTPPPLEVVLDNLEFFEAPSREIERSVLLSWSVNTEEEQVPVTADSLTNPMWVLLPEPIFKRYRDLCVAVPVAKTEQYFQLVPGKQFVDDFSAVLPAPFTARADWTLLCADPSDTNRIYSSTVDDSLRIHIIWPIFPVDGRVWAVPPRADLVVRDFRASVDILCWPNLLQPAPLPVCGILARATVNAEDPVSSGGDLGAISRSADGKTGKLMIRTGGDTSEGPAFAYDAGAVYRLVFSGVGDDLALHLLDVRTGATVSEVGTKATDFGQGAICLYVEGRRHDIALDNVFVTGTKP